MNTTILKSIISDFMALFRVYLKTGNITNSEGFFV